MEVAREAEVEVEEAKEVDGVANTIMTELELAFESLRTKTCFIPTHFLLLKNLRV